jgi:hypothetical protein
MDIFNVYSSVFSAFPVLNEFMIFMVMICGMIFSGAYCFIWGVLLQPEIQIQNEEMEFSNYSWAWARKEEWEEEVVVLRRWDSMETSVLTAWSKEKAEPLTVAYVIAAQQPYPWKRTTIDELLM